MQSIRTKWLAPTNYRGARIKAISASGHSTVVVSWDYALNVQANHNAAAEALAVKMQWPGEWVSGDWDGLGGYVYINLSGPRDGFTFGGIESCAKGEPTGDTSDRPNKHGVAWLFHWSKGGSSGSAPCRTYAEAYALAVERAGMDGKVIPERAIPAKPDGFDGWRYTMDNGLTVNIRRA